MTIGKNRCIIFHGQKSKWFAHTPLLDYCVLGNANRIATIGAFEMVEIEVRWLSVDEISMYFGVSSRAEYRWFDRHDISAQRIEWLWNLKFKKIEVDE